jgi:hypothetical protein
MAHYLQLWSEVNKEFIPSGRGLIVLSFEKNYLTLSFPELLIN